MFMGIWISAFGTKLDEGAEPKIRQDYIPLVKADRIQQSATTIQIMHELLSDSQEFYQARDLIGSAA